MNKFLPIIGLLALVILIGLVACAPSEEAKAYKHQVRANEQRVQYIKDERTGLCFAVITVYPVSDSASIKGIGFTMIPCPRIEQFVERNIGDDL